MASKKETDNGKIDKKTNDDTIDEANHRCFPAEMSHGASILFSGFGCYHCQHHINLGNFSNYASIKMEHFTTRLRKAILDVLLQMNHKNVYNFLLFLFSTRELQFFCLFMHLNLFHVMKSYLFLYIYLKNYFFQYKSALNKLYLLLSNNELFRFIFGFLL